MRDIIREDARLIMLRELNKQNDYQLNDGLLRATLESFGIGKSREWVRDELEYLEDMNAVKLTTAGSVVVARGETLMMGYWEQPQETAKAVVDGWMHTGDGGYMNEDGYVFVVDRIKVMIITGGENVYSAEVENIIARHPAVAQCAVIGLPDPMWGERVHAVIMLKPGATLTLDELTGFCREHIAAYKCPRGATIGDVPLPLSGAGKILKRQLRETLGAPSGL